jgi:dihydroorotase
VNAMSCLPAKVFHLPGGTLRPGSIGDVTVFDAKREWTVNSLSFKSKGRNTPYGGRKLVGQARATVVGGRVVYRAPE